MVFNAAKTHNDATLQIKSNTSTVQSVNGVIDHDVLLMWESRNLLLRAQMQ